MKPGTVPSSIERMAARTAALTWPSPTSAIHSSNSGRGLVRIARHEPQISGASRSPVCLLLTPPEQSYGSVSESEAIALSCHHILCGPEKSSGPVIASSLRLLGLAVQPSGGPDLGFAVRLLSLGFGPWEHRVAVETSTEPIDDHRMIVELLMGPELTYPLTIDEGSWFCSSTASRSSFVPCSSKRTSGLGSPLSTDVGCTSAEWASHRQTSQSFRWTCDPLQIGTLRSFDPQDQPLLFVLVQ